MYLQKYKTVKLNVIIIKIDTCWLQTRIIILILCHKGINFTKIYFNQYVYSVCHDYCKCSQALLFSTPEFPNLFSHGKFSNLKYRDVI